MITSNGYETEEVLSIISMQDVGLYYPVATRVSIEQIKTLLLFFDQVVLLTLNREHDTSSVIDRQDAEPFLEKNLIRVVDLAEVVDREIASKLKAVLQDATSWQALEPIGREDHFYYGRKVYFTLNGPEPSLETMLLRNELIKLIGAGTTYRENEHSPQIPTYRFNGESLSVPVHIRLWAPLLSVLPQILRAGGFKRGVDLQPITNLHQFTSAIKTILQLPGMPSSNFSIFFELEQVALDLSFQPIDEVVRFREEHGQRYRTYKNNLRKFVRELSFLNGSEGSQLLNERLDKISLTADTLRSQGVAERREELAVEADELRKLARRWWRRPLATFGLGIVGAAWNEQRSSSLLKHLANAIGATLDGKHFDTYTYFFSSNVSLKS
jgi:hypothetical protein